MNKKQKKPELLAPAGTREALDAAIRAGADAVYFGGRFNARIFADNFAGDAMGEAIRACAFYGVRSNITLNTVPLEREQAEVLRYAEQLCLWGADAVICADLGTAALLHRYFPSLALHASTQAMGHNTDAARFFAAHGFSRMVAARELSFPDLARLCADSPIETEMFVHGAICVSQSGGCLFSSLVGGRSGNRGACAQPCRLPYECTLPEGGIRHTEETFPLSLRDMCLAEHIPEILTLGAASLKIEGRMKSPAYVEGVLRIYRRLLDEERAASREELSELAALFSRGGFTDGYFSGKIGKAMRGTRSESDKAATAAAEKKILSGRQEQRRLPVTLSFEMRHDVPCTLKMTLRCPDTENAAEDAARTVCVTGEIPAAAQNRETTRDDLVKNLAKLGSTPFSASEIAVSAESGLSLSLAAVNAMRREAAGRLENAWRMRKLYPERGETPRFADGTLPAELCSPPLPRKTDYARKRQALFLFAENIPEEAKNAYDLIYLPIAQFDENPEKALLCGVNAVALPPVLFDREQPAVCGMMDRARAFGISHVLVANAGQIAAARERGFLLHGSFRFNLYTALSAEVFAGEGFSDLLMSAELTLPQLADIRASVPTGAVTYGRLPLMTLERCILREETRLPDGAPCSRCTHHPISYLTDRKKTVFPAVRTYPHRNLILNSAPVYMADRQEALDRAGLGFTLHIFTVETKEEAAAVLRAYRDGTDGVPYAGFPSFRRLHG